MEAGRHVYEEGMHVYGMHEREAEEGMHVRGVSDKRQRKQCINSLLQHRRLRPQSMPTTVGKAKGSA